jgi:hypothetical protein
MLGQQRGQDVRGRCGLCAHPAIAIERDSRLAVARLLREMDLSVTASDERRTAAQEIRGSLAPLPLVRSRTRNLTSARARSNRSQEYASAKTIGGRNPIGQATLFRVACPPMNM